MANISDAWYMNVSRTMLVFQVARSRSVELSFKSLKHQAMVGKLLVFSDWLLCSTCLLCHLDNIPHVKIDNRFVAVEGRYA